MSGILAVTGATGKSGHVFVKCLVDNNKQIAGMFSGGYRFLIRKTPPVDFAGYQLPDVDFVCGDLTNQNYVNQALVGVDTVVHIAGIHWSRTVVQAAAENNVRRLIMVHTTGIYSKYKAAGEEYREIDAEVSRTCQANGIILTVLRPTMIYGCVKDRNVITFIKMVDKYPIMPVVNGARYELQPVHYRDLGIAYYQVLTHEETTANCDYDLSGAEPIQLRKMLLEIGNNLDKNVHFFSVSYPIAYIGAILVYALTFTKKDYREKVQRLCETRVYPHDKAKEDFNYNPVPFETGVMEEIKEYCAKVINR